MQQPVQPQQPNQDIGAILLNWQTPFDQEKLNLLTQVVTAMYSGNRQNTEQANQLMNQFKSHEDAWTVVDFIVIQSTDINTRFFGLSILDEAVNMRWNILDAESKLNMRNFMVNLVLNLPEQLKGQQHASHLLTKLNSTLISIVKREWGISWQNFIQDICNSATENEAKCENALNILRLLSEEVFDFSKGTVLQKDAELLKKQMNDQFEMVYKICIQVLTNSEGVSESLIKSCLKTLQAFLSWIPLQFIFDTNLMEILIKQYIHPAQTRIEAIKCFTEISSLTFSEMQDQPQMVQQCKERLCYYFCLLMQQIGEMTKQRSLLQEFENVAETKQQTGFENFAKQLALAISAVLKNNIDLIEQTTNILEPNENIEFLRGATRQGLMYLVQLSRIPEEELFKICLEFWHFFAEDTLKKTQGSRNQQAENLIPGMNLGNFGMQQQGASSQLHLTIYPEILNEVKELHIDEMAKPKEVLICIDENGDVEEEFFEDTENLALYEQMRETLIFMTNQDTKSMAVILQRRLSALSQQRNQVDFNKLNRLCWALGSISGCMGNDDENKFVCHVIKELLNLCEGVTSKNSKAQIATDIMYVVSQFPTFLINHWAFLKTVFNKLHEFMHETHPGVQDMAAETYLKIAKLTSHKFITCNEKDQEPYIYTIIRMLPNNLQKLEQRQVLMVYEGIGWMISAEQVEQTQATLIQNLLAMSHSQFTGELNKFNMDASQIFNMENIKTIDQVIKINQRVAESVGSAYLLYLRNIFDDLLKIYNIYSQQISTFVSQNQAENTLIKPMKAVRRDILKLIQIYITKEQDKQYVVFSQYFLPSLKLLVEDFQGAHPQARDPEVLMLFSTMMKHMGETLATFLPDILKTLCDSTLNEIQSDFTQFPEFREGFFRLIMNIIKHCTNGLFMLDAGAFQRIVLTVIFAMQHEKPDLMELGLDSMHSLIVILKESPQTATTFYQSFYTQILKETLTVMIDYRHMSGFKMQALIMQQLIQAVDGTEVLDPNTKLHASEGQPHQFDTNKAFVQELLKDSLLTMFQNLNSVQVEGFVIKLFNTVYDWSEFKGTLRDLLISMRSFASTDDAFYEEERQAALQKQEELAAQKRAAIPGMNKPSDGNNGFAANGNFNQQFQK